MYDPIMRVLTVLEILQARDHVTGAELAERLEASGYDIPASEIQAGLELNLPCLVVTGQGNSGYKIIKEFLPEAA